MSVKSDSLAGNMENWGTVPGFLTFFRNGKAGTEGKPGIVPATRCVLKI